MLDGLGHDGTRKRTPSITDIVNAVEAGLNDVSLLAALDALQSLLDEREQRYWENNRIPPGEEGALNSVEAEAATREAIDKVKRVYSQVVERCVGADVNPRGRTH